MATTFADFAVWEGSNQNCSFRFVNGAVEVDITLAVSSLRIKQPLRITGEAVFTDISGERRADLSGIQYYRDVELDYKELDRDSIQFSEVIARSIETMFAGGEIYFCPAEVFTMDVAHKVLLDPSDDLLGIYYDEQIKKLPAKAVFKGVDAFVMDSATAIKYGVTVSYGTGTDGADEITVVYPSSWSGSEATGYVLYVPEYAVINSTTFRTDD